MISTFLKIAMIVGVLVVTSCQSFGPASGPTGHGPERRVAGKDMGHKMAAYRLGKFGLPVGLGGPGNPMVMAELQRDEDAVSCMRDICGKEDKNFSASDVLGLQERGTKYVEGSRLYQEFDRSIRKLMAAEHKNKLREIKNLEWYGTQKDFSMPHSYRRYSNGVILLGAFLRFLSKKIEDGFVGKSLSDYYGLLATGEELKDIGLSEVESKIYLQAQESGFFSGMDGFIDTDQTLREILLGLYPYSSFSEALQTSLAECAASNEEFYRMAGLSFERSAKRNYCAELIKNPDQPVVESELKGDLHLLSYGKYIAKPQFANFLDLNFADLKTLYEAKMNSKGLADWRALLKRDYKSDAESLEQIKKCHSNISRAIEVSRSSAYKKNWRYYVQTLLAQTEKLIRFQDKKLQSEFVRKLNEFKYTFPQSEGELIASLKRGFQRAEEDALADRSYSDFTKRVIAIFGFYSGSVESDTVGFSTLFEDISELCTEGKSDAFGDHIYTARGDAYFSWPTLYYPQFGIGIAAHELGHFVSGILRSMGTANGGSNYLGLPEQIPLWESRQCVNKRYSPTESFGSEKPWTEEAWADHFAAKLLASLQSGTFPWVKNPDCLGAQEVDGKYSPDSKLSLDGIHPYNLSRIINTESILKSGVLPKSCQRLREAKHLCNH